jgi:urease accessory protein
MLVNCERERLTVPGSATRVRASLQLDFEFDGATGRTVLRGSRQQAPLRVVRAFTQEDGAALVHLHNVSGGLLGGDRLELAVKVAPGAAAQLTSTGATRVYRALAGYSDTVQVNCISVAENALLEYVPDPLIPFAGARLRQFTSIHLAGGAGLFWWDIVAPGREARGEVFAYERLEVQTTLQACGRWIAIERVRLEPGKRRLTAPARMGDYRYWATFYICRVGLDAKLWLEAERQLRCAAQDAPQSGASLWGVSAMPAHGLVVRGLTLHGRDAIAGVRAIWQAAKRLLFGREVILPRKIN